MRKILTSILAFVLVVPLFLQNNTQAAPAISIYIDGAYLATDQAPVAIQGRVLLPLRAIFEALDATVDWNQWTQTVTAKKDNTTVVLKLNTKTATINNETVTLDVPAQSIKGRTMVPVRFVSEALGQEVGWNSQSKTVTIKTNKVVQPETVSPVSHVTLRDVGNNGDGRDLEVSFSRSSTETLVDHYRILAVKAENASGFNLTNALKVTSANYTTVWPSGADPSVRLTSGARDIDGAAIKNGQAYTVYVLAIGKNNSGNALSYSSSQITLDPGASVDAASNVKAHDISDYGDGRDLSVSFTRPQNDSNINSYRVFIVKTKDAGSFNLSAANSNKYYTTVSKSGSNTTLTGTLSSSSRDTAGDLIKDSVSYTAFVLSLSNNTNTAGNRLSSASSAIVLSKGSVASPVITRVEDISDHGDGRDLQVSFTRIADESKISGYRIFVVKASDYSSFNLARANTVSSGNYTEVKKTGYNQDQYLASGAKDVDGAAIRNGVSYRVFVMAVGNGSNNGSNGLSNASSAITLLNNYSVGSVRNLRVGDVDDRNDGRDLLVSFDRATDESNISQYRIMVVKNSKSSSFNLSKANDVSSDRYTKVNTGYNFSEVLSSGAKDVDGDTIQNGVSYRVYVLSVGKGSYSGNNTLSGASSAITLTNNYSVGAVSGLAVKDIGDDNNGSDLQVSFNRATDESNIDHYRILVVKASDYSKFNLAKADKSNDYTTVAKTGKSLVQELSSRARDVDGDLIKDGVKYRVFVLSVGTRNYSGSNALSSASSEITLADTSSVSAVTGLSVKAEGNSGSAEDITVSFTKPSNQTNIAEYRILVVPSDKADSFGLNQANKVTIRDNYTTVDTGGSRTEKVSVQSSNDAFGNEINTKTTYQVFVLTVAKSGKANALSGASDQVKIKASPAESTAVPAVSSATVYLNESDLNVKFSKPSKSDYILSYQFFVVSPGTKVDLKQAVEWYEDGKTTDAANVITKDINNHSLDKNKDYDVYILSVPDMKNARIFALSKAFKPGEDTLIDRVEF